MYIFGNDLFGLAYVFNNDKMFGRKQHKKQT